MIWRDGTTEELVGSAVDTTHNRMQLTAVCEALETVRGAIEVRTDSTYQRGRNRSVHRLYKVALSIATFAKNRLRRNDSVPDRAVKTWADDFDWLRRTYYEGHSGFPWPPLELD